MKLRKKTFQKFGHTWKWNRAGGGWRNHWQSTSGNLVRVFSPIFYRRSWLVIVCDKDCYELKGTNVYNRAFSVAETLTRQNRQDPK